MSMFREAVAEVNGLQAEIQKLVQINKDLGAERDKFAQRIKELEAKVAELEGEAIADGVKKGKLKAVPAEQ